MSLKQVMTLAVIRDKITSNAYNQTTLHPRDAIIDPTLSEEDNFNLVRDKNNEYRESNKAGFEVFKSDCMAYLDTLDYTIADDKKNTLINRLSNNKSFKHKLEDFMRNIQSVKEAAKRLEGAVVLSTTQAVTIKFNPEVILKTYLLKVASSFEPYTGANMQLTLDKVFKGREEIPQAVFIQELLELADVHSYSYPRLDVQYTHSWVASDSGYSGHDTLATQVTQIVITYNVIQA